MDRALACARQPSTIRPNASSTAQAEELLAKARLFNVERSYPYHLVKRACEEQK